MRNEVFYANGVMSLNLKLYMKEQRNNEYLVNVRVETLWVKLNSMVKYFLNVAQKVTETENCLNNDKGPKHKLINLLIIMKHYIYSTKFQEENLHFIHFMNRVAQWYNSIEILYFLLIKKNSDKAKSTGKTQGI